MCPIHRFTALLLLLAVGIPSLAAEPEPGIVVATDSEPGVVVVRDSEPDAVLAADSQPAFVVAAESEPAVMASHDVQSDCFDFSKVPPVPRPLVRSGLYSYWPTGPGYYTFLDRLRGELRDKPQPYPYPPHAMSTLSFFDADWRFVDNPDYDPDFLERLKRLHVGRNWLVSTGGQTWFRWADEYNSRLTETTNDYTLVRIRPYADVWYQDRFRFFIEGIFADTSHQTLPPQGTDINRGDFQNLFVEAPIGEVADKEVYARVGRQEIQLGSQRLVGTPDWGNTRRTFQGARMYRVGEKWDADLFWLQPVFPNPVELDSGDNNQNFAGAWVTHRPKKGTFLDMYYLMLDNQNQATQQGIVRSPFTIHTIGARYISDIHNRILYESEGAIQLGRRGDANVLAGMYSGGLGYHWEDTTWNPTFWAYYNYTSGDNNPNAGSYHTFNQLFPFIHYYMGWVDAVGRQNNHDINARLYLYPNNWVTLLAQYHRFWLDSPTDALYNIGGVAYRRDPTGRSGRDVGQKIDLQSNFHLSRRADLLVGYSYLWGGDFLRNTASPTAAVDSSIYYMSGSYRW